MSTLACCPHKGLAAGKKPMKPMKPMKPTKAPAKKPTKLKCFSL